MSVFRSLLANIKSSRLPSAYQEVEYIQGTGTQYLDTGFVLNQGMLAQYTLNYPATTTNASIVSSHNLTSPYGRNGAGGYNFNSYANGWELGYEGAYSYSYAISLNTMYDVELSTIIGNAYIKVNGSVLGTRTETVTLSSNNVYIFANSYSIAHSEQKTMVKFYSLKLYNNNLTLIGDYVPCYRKSDGEIGLYNLVDGNFLTNQGTGTFLKGENV